MKPYKVIIPKNRYTKQWENHLIQFMSKDGYVLHKTVEEKPCKSCGSITFEFVHYLDFFGI